MLQQTSKLTYKSNAYPKIKKQKLLLQVKASNIRNALTCTDADAIKEKSNTRHESHG